MKTIKVLVLFFVLATGNCQQIYHDLAKFCNDNGMVFTSLTTSYNDLPMKKEATKAVQALVKDNVRVRNIPFEKLMKVIEFDTDVHILLSDLRLLDDTNKFRMYMQTLGEHKIKRSILIFSEELNKEKEAMLSDNLNNLLEVNGFFYSLYQKPGNKTAYKQILSLQNTTQTVFQDVEVNSLNQITENFDMEGMFLISNTLSWAPYFTVENCNSMGQNCELGGFLADYMDAMGKIMNFTWTSYAPPDGSWGVRPISGPFNKSGVWGGAMGSVVNGEYHISLSQWVWNVERYRLLDFVSTSTNRVCLALTPQAPEIDPGLFTRPFTDDAWYGIGFITGVIFLVLMIPYAFIDYYEETDGYNITAFWSWMFFLLVNAFYGGALTMFFTSELSIPFNSIEDVMLAYPSWKLKMMTGNDVHFQYKALQGDPLYSQFWDRVTNLPEETVFANLPEGLDILLQERAVIHTFTGMLKGFFQANPFRQQNLKVFAYGRPTYYTLIIPFNSPLKPILQKASNILTETGANDYLIKAWEGKDIPQLGAVEVMVLTVGQTILVFMITIACFSAVGMVFCCELVHKSVKDFKEQKVTIVDQQKQGSGFRKLIPKDLMKRFQMNLDNEKEFYAGSGEPIRPIKNSQGEVVWY